MLKQRAQLRDGGPRTADLGGPPRTGPLRDLVIDASRIAGNVGSGEVSVLVLAYEEDQLRNGMPRAGALPGFMWVGEAVKFTPELRLRAPVPSIPGLDAIVLLDTDGDKLPSPEEPMSRAFEDFTPPPEGTAWQVAIDRTFQPGRVDRTGSATSTSGESDGVGVRLVLDAEPRIKLQRSTRLMVVGYEDEDIEGGKPMSDGDPAFLWWRQEPDIDWPLMLDAQVPTVGRYLVVIDLDENHAPTAGDLTTALTVPPDPKAAAGSEVRLVLNRTLTFAEGDDEESQDAEREDSRPADDGPRNGRSPQ